LARWPSGLASNRARAGLKAALLGAVLSAAPAGAGDLAFVTNQSSGDLSVIDLASGAELPDQIGDTGGESAAMTDTGDGHSAACWLLVRHQEAIEA